MFCIKPFPISNQTYEFQDEDAQRANVREYHRDLQNLSSHLKMRFGIKPSLYGDIGFSRAMFDRDNKLMRLSITKDEKYRLYTPINKISDKLQKAVLLYEDKEFYQHYGVNFKSLLNAFVRTYISGRRKIGGSTITMQLARLRFKINSSQIHGKIWQIVKAIQLELYYTKDEILEAYLNLIPYGGNIEGIGAASYIYFNRNPLELNLFDSLTLAVIPQNPVKRLPRDSFQSQTSGVRKHLYLQWIKITPKI
jgi:penicillin-binding protein 1C